MKIKVRKYTKDDTDKWNLFISKAKNSTFLLKRSYMDYHKNNFDDYSIIVEDEGEFVAVLPANIDNNLVSSHSGLTYGGFILDIKTSVSKNILYIKLILKYLFDNNIHELKLKLLPDFYSKCSQSEIEYSLFLLNANLERVDTALVIDNSNNFNRKIPKGRKSEISKAKKHGIYIKESTQFDSFWNLILIPNLKSRFNVKPVHSLDEITSLKNYNYENIKQFNAYLGDEILAGTTIYETDTTIHLQYIAGNDLARSTGALDFLFYHLIALYSEKCRFFDFGIVNEKAGRKINVGMLKWKESFGSRFYLHKFYRIKTENYKNLEIKTYSSK